MNVELIKSYTLKLLPVVAAWAVGRGYIDQAIADQLGPLVEWVFVGIALVPTFLRSWRNYGKTKNNDPVNLRPA